MLLFVRFSLTLAILSVAVSFGMFVLDMKISKSLSPALILLYSYGPSFFIYSLCFLRYSMVYKAASIWSVLLIVLVTEVALELIGFIVIGNVLVQDDWFLNYAVIGVGSFCGFWVGRKLKGWPKEEATPTE